jgi:hypothetical protein
MERDPFVPPNPPALRAARLLARKEQVMTAFHEQQDPERQTTSARRATAWSRRRRYLAMAGASAALAATAALLPSLLTTTATATPAYALTANNDGSVTFVINDISDPEGATRALHKAGVRAIVLQGQSVGSCPAGTEGVVDDTDLLTLGRMFTTGPDTENGYTLVIFPDRIPKRAVLVLTAAPPSPLSTPRPRSKPLIRLGLYRQPAPTCTEMPTPDPVHAPPR